MHDHAANRQDAVLQAGKDLRTTYAMLGRTWWATGQRSDIVYDS